MTTKVDHWAEVRAGLRDALPILSAIAPYAAVFGAIAVESGLSLTEALVTSGSIYAVASQYVMVETMQDGLPIWAILLAVLAVNFRHVLYSAASVRWMGAFTKPQKIAAFFFLHDAQYASSEARAAKTIVQPAWYFAYGMFVYIGWMVSNLLGAVFGGLIGDQAQFGLDMVLPLFFAGLVFGLRAKPRFGAVLCVSVGSALLAYFTVGSPWHITLGGGAGIFTAAALSRPLSLDQEAEYV